MPTLNGLYGIVGIWAVSTRPSATYTSKGDLCGTKKLTSSIISNKQGSSIFWNCNHHGSR